MLAIYYIALAHCLMVAIFWFNCPLRSSICEWRKASIAYIQDTPDLLRQLEDLKTHTFSLDTFPVSIDVVGLYSLKIVILITEIYCNKKKVIWNCLLIFAVGRTGCYFQKLRSSNILYSDFVSGFFIYVGMKFLLPFLFLQ